ncbi:transmembrane and immunoglobulin domain-containing protein 1 [Vipera latastei]
MEGALYLKLLFVVATAPGVVAGLELSINANTADFELATEAGRSQSLWCALQHHGQEEELLWLRGDAEVELQEGNRLNASNVCLSPVGHEDHGVSFTCLLARDRSVRVSVLLNVTYPPALSGEDPPAIPAEWDVTLDCRVKANPPAQLSWLKDNEPLSLEDTRYWILRTSELFQLTIKRLQPSDRGIYTCVADSPLGWSRKDFHLVVEERKLPFPNEAVIGAGVVLSLIALFGLVVRWEKIVQFFQKRLKKTDSPSHTAL